MYTDGVIEAINSEEIPYGTEQLVDTLHSLAHLPLLEVLHGIRESLDQFIHGSPPEDDVTFIIARVV
jgi:serine phosphatase RsbU (regulator of sigma subunit)